MSQNPSNKAAETRKKVSNGTGNYGLLQTNEQADNVADVAGAAGANPTQAEYAVAVAAINDLKDALVSAGIMKSA